MNKLQKMLKSDPNVHTISSRDNQILCSKLKKKSRTEKDWDIIKEILMNCDVITMVPSVESDDICTVEHVLCVHGNLKVFTTVRTCKEYFDVIRTLYTEQIHGQLYGIGTIPFEEVAILAEEKEMLVDIDDPVVTERTFLILDGKNHRLKASKRPVDPTFTTYFRSMQRLFLTSHRR